MNSYQRARRPSMYHSMGNPKTTLSEPRRRGYKVTFSLEIDIEVLAKNEDEAYDIAQEELCLNDAGYYDIPVGAFRVDIEEVG